MVRPRDHLLRAAHGLGLQPGDLGHRLAAAQREHGAELLVRLGALGGRRGVEPGPLLGGVLAQPLDLLVVLRAAPGHLVDLEPGLLALGRDRRDDLGGVRGGVLGGGGAHAAELVAGEPEHHLQAVVHARHAVRRSGECPQLAAEPLDLRARRVELAADGVELLAELGGLLAAAARSAAMIVVSALIRFR
ncbi:hypothetical protein BJF78_16680 [Pseudonocardia sp. CNS-139]|nr:hypothetical protein BJF78_16680 [Pseudonocardia sp. CNS-139]